MTVFWAVLPCGQSGRSWSTFRMRLLPPSSGRIYLIFPMIEAARASETSADFYRTKYTFFVFTACVDVITEVAALQWDLWRHRVTTRNLRDVCMLCFTEELEAWAFITRGSHRGAINTSPPSFSQNKTYCALGKLPASSFLTCSSLAFFIPPSPNQDRHFNASVLTLSFQ